MASLNCPLTNQDDFSHQLHHAGPHQVPFLLTAVAPASGDLRSLRGLPLQSLSCAGEGVSCSVVSASFDPVDCSQLGSSVCEFSRQEYRSGLPFPSPEDLPDPGIKPGSPTSQADSLPSEPPGKPKRWWCWAISLSHASLVSGPLNLALALLGCISSDLQDTVTGHLFTSCCTSLPGAVGPFGEMKAAEPISRALDSLAALRQLGPWGGAVCIPS